MFCSSNYNSLRPNGGILSNCRRHTPLKDCPQTCQTRHWWRQSWLPWRSHHPNCSSYHCQTALKQCGLNAEWKILMYRHQQFLPGYPPWPPRICPHSHKKVPQQLIGKYNLASISSDSYLYLKVVKGMCDFPQAGILANKLLKTWLASHRYIECAHTPGLWKHVFRPTTFTLWVDEFGICYTSTIDAMHLMKTLQQWYKIKMIGLEPHTVVSH